MKRTKSWLWFIRSPWAMWVYFVVLNGLNGYKLYEDSSNVLGWVGLVVVTLVVPCVLRDKYLDRQGRLRS